MEGTPTKSVKENTMENTERRKRSVKDEDEEEPCSKRAAPAHLIETEEATDVEELIETEDEEATDVEELHVVVVGETGQPDAWSDHDYTKASTEAPSLTDLFFNPSERVEQWDESLLGGRHSEVPKPAMTWSTTSAFPASTKTLVPVTFSPQTVKSAVSCLIAKPTQTDVPKPASTITTAPLTSAIRQTEVPKPAVTSSTASAFPASTKTSVPVAFSLGTVKHAVDSLAFTSTVTMTATTVTTSWSNLSTTSMCQPPLIAPPAEMRPRLKNAESLGTWSDGSTETSLRPPTVTSARVFSIFPSGKVKCAVSSLSTGDTQTNVPNPASTLNASPVTSVPVVLSPLTFKHIVDRLALTSSVKTSEASLTDLTTSVIPPRAELKLRPKRTTRVVMEYEGKTSKRARILRGKWEAVAMFLCQGRFDAIPRKIMEVPGMREIVVKEVMKLVNKECNKVASYKFNSIMRRTSPDELKDFKWVNLINEWKATAPTFLSFLEATSCSTSNPSKRHPMAMAGATLLKARGDSLCAPMFRNSMILWHGGAKKRCINMMARLGLCVSFTATLHKRKSIEHDFDSSFLQRIASLSETVDTDGTTAEGTIDPPPPGSSSNEPQQVVSQRGPPRVSKWGGRSKKAFYKWSEKC